MKYRVAIRGMNQTMNSCSDKKYFIISGDIYEVCEDIRKEVFPKYPEIVIEEMEAAE